MALTLEAGIQELAVGIGQEVKAINIAVAAKEPAIAINTSTKYYRGDKTFQTLDRTAVGLGNVDNTADSAKPVSTAQAAAIALKANAATTLNGYGITDAYTSTQIDSKFATLVGTAPATLDTFQELAAQMLADESGVAALTTTVATKAPIASPTFTGTVSGVTKAMVGLNNVDNTADSAKPVSTAQAAANTVVQTTAATDATTKANAAQAAAIAASAPIAHVGSGAAAHAVVTTTVNGFMSSTDKVKIDAITGTNTGDETTTTIKTKLGISTLSGVNTGDQVIPTTLPASDVYAWAKATTKPSYTATEVGAPTGSGTSSGINTGDQTSVTGNSGTATKLQTARLVAGVSFDGSSDIAIPFANLISKPTTLAGYGITDASSALTTASINSALGYTAANQTAVNASFTVVNTTISALTTNIGNTNADFLATFNAAKA